MRSLLILLITLQFAASIRAEDAHELSDQAAAILSKRCFQCHGPDEGSREADLRLDQAKFALAAVAESGDKVVAPGNAAKSELIARIQSTDADVVMPPADAGPPLTAKEVSILKKWIDQGADWPKHWSFRPLAAPPIPSPVSFAEPTDWETSRSLIDRFIRRRLRAADLQPAQPANRETLIRRLSLDLIGLPPTPEEVAAFVADDRPDAYERLVDRLLASPAFGERWATMWLDLARYADSRGYEQDNPRQIWPWRDWVIEAYNRDMGLNQFTIEQLAGDLLPDALHEQLVATAFHRNTMTNDEGGTDNEEFRVAAVKDRVDVTMQVWMGLTAGCAKCHTHKYDPISLREYYEMYAIFNQTADADLSDDSPTLRLPTYEHQKEEDRLRENILAVEKELATPDAKEREAAEEWAKQLAAGPNWKVLRPSNAYSSSGSDFRLLSDSSLLVSGRLPFSDSYLIELPIDLPQVTAVRIETLLSDSLPAGGPGRERGTGKFVLSELSASVQTGPFDLVPLRFNSVAADYSQPGFSIEHALHNSNIRMKGWAVGPFWRDNHLAVYSAARPVRAGNKSLLLVRIQQRFAKEGLSLGRFRISATADTDLNLNALAPDNVVEIARKPAAKRSEKEQRLLYRRHAYQAKSAATDLKKIIYLEDAIRRLNVPQTPIMRQLVNEEQRETHIHNRGNFLDLGDKVEPAAPASWHAFPANEEVNRLSLAKWLIDESNPLVDRVAVNRVWARFFGVGLVETEEDFGSQGLPPTHPQLLDYLATEFRDQGRSHKTLCRAIVMSATYRQSSRVSKAARKIDPRNQLLSHSPRVRLTAEKTRDAALAVSGLLSRKLHGAPVMPPQPEGIWQHVFSDSQWVTSRGEDRYRRGLYTYLRRTSPYPAMTMMDGPSREICTVRRIPTNTPLAVLVTLNDPAFVESAQSLGRQTALRGDAPPSTMPKFTDNLDWLYRKTLSRPPRAAEVEIMRELYDQRLAHYEEHTGEAKLWAGTPDDFPASHLAEAAAWTGVANALLNLDEFLTRP